MRDHQLVTSCLDAFHQKSMADSNMRAKASMCKGKACWQESAEKRRQGTWCKKRVSLQGNNAKTTNTTAFKSPRHVRNHADERAVRASNVPPTIFSIIFAAKNMMRREDIFVESRLRYLELILMMPHIERDSFHRRY